MSISFKYSLMDPIHGSIGITETEDLFIKSKEFQRLKYIRQLGNAHFVFPGAVHNRFSHSVGTMHIASKIFSSLFRDYMHLNSVSELHQMFRIAALNHDIGHGPFSHIFESIGKDIWPACRDWEPENQNIEAIYEERKILNKTIHHEFISYLIIRDLTKKLNIQSFSGLDICQILSVDFKLTGKLHQVLQDVGKEIGFNKVHDLRTCLSTIINGPFDADRLDYMMRDAYFSGVKVSIDIDHVLDSIKFCHDENSCYIHVKKNAISTFESILYARKYLYDQVYHHPRIYAFDYLMKKILTDTPHNIPKTLKDYLRMTDFHILSIMDESGHPMLDLYQRGIGLELISYEDIKEISSDIKRLVNRDQILESINLKMISPKEGQEIYRSNVSGILSPVFKHFKSISRLENELSNRVILFKKQEKKSSAKEDYVNVS